MMPDDLNPVIETAVISIGSRRELLVDRYLVDRLSGDISYRLHHPVAREVVEGVADGSGHTYRYMTILRDGEEYRMYYALLDRKRVKGPVVANGDERICLATSRDGLHWQRPCLQLFEQGGSTENSIVWMEDGKTRFGVSGFSPFVDTNPACPPQQRYKAVAEAGPKSKKALGYNGLFTLSSPDGIHWSTIGDKPVMTGGPGRGNFDTQNLAFWDGERQEYRLYRREYYYEGPQQDFRDILTATSRDFIHWSEPQRLRYPGARPEQLYTNNVQPYFRAPHLFIGFPVRYLRMAWDQAVAALPERERRVALIVNNGAAPDKVDPTGEGGERVGTALTDALFMSSRDGLHFHRWGEAFIRPGLRTCNNWFYADNFPAWGLVTTPSGVEGGPEELSFYITEGARREGQPNLCRRHTLRMDGFVSAHAGGDEGELQTKSLIFEGQNLWINFSASVGGYLEVELQDEYGWPLPGFAMGEGVRLLGDDLDRRVQWKKQADLASFAGKPVRIRFRLRDADLYAFQFR